MKMPEKIKEEYLAYCGVNCLLCTAYHHKKNPCPGCRTEESSITGKSFRNCSKKKCTRAKGVYWCFECEEFPCRRIKDLSRSYSKNYSIELVKEGREAEKDRTSFLEKQRQHFRCGKCGGIIDMHNEICTDCGEKK